MKTIKLISIAVAFAFATTTQSHAENPTTESFTNLQQAVDFIATALESTNTAAIAAACIEKPNQLDLTHLQDLNKAKPLRTLYAHRTFPTEADAFKLGGHMSELGFIHINFIRTNGIWYLNSIMECH